MDGEHSGELPGQVVRGLRNKSYKQ